VSWCLLRHYVLKIILGSILNVDASNLYTIILTLRRQRKFILFFGLFANKLLLKSRTFIIVDTSILRKRNPFPHKLKAASLHPNVNFVDLLFYRF
jgi:hypothetical protein